MIDHAAGCLGQACTCKQAFPGVTYHVVCPVCQRNLVYTSTSPEAWGTVNLEDYGTVSITAMDSGVIRKHMDDHIKADRKHMATLGTRRANFWTRWAERIGAA